MSLLDCADKQVPLVEPLLGRIGAPSPSILLKQKVISSDQAIRKHLYVEPKLKSKRCESAYFFLHDRNVRQHEDHVLLVTYQLLYYFSVLTSFLRANKNLKHQNLGHHGLPTTGGK